jgi:hypothetical protein
MIPEVRAPAGDDWTVVPRRAVGGEVVVVGDRGVAAGVLLLGGAQLPGQHLGGVLVGVAALVSMSRSRSWTAGPLPIQHAEPGAASLFHTTAQLIMRLYAL